MCSAVWRRKNEIANGSGIYQELPERGGSSTIPAGNNRGFSRRTQSQIGVEKKHASTVKNTKSRPCWAARFRFDRDAPTTLRANPSAKTQPKRPYSRTDRIRQSNPSS